MPHSLNNTIKGSHKKTWLGRAKSRAPFIFGVMQYRERTMELAKESYRIHSLAWKEYDKTKDHLSNALSLLSGAYENGDRDNVVVNNLAAVLLDSYQDEKALEVLKVHKPECAEFCLNYAIAIAKTNLADIEEIRKWNKAAANYPKAENAIIAYMDWQAL